MTDAPEAPKRCGRKIIVAFVLLSLVLSWWYSRRDARFVGRWQAIDPKDVELLGVLRFDSDGTAVFQSIFGRSVYYQWSDFGDELRLVRFSKLEPTLLDRAVFRIAKLLPLISQIDPSMNVSAFEGRFRVLIPASDQLEIRHMSGDSEFSGACTLRRMPE